MASKYTFAVAGTSHYTQLLAQNLIDSGNFTPTFALTPAPTPSGRKKELRPNPIHLWAETNNLPLALITDKITPELITQALTSPSNQSSKSNPLNQTPTNSPNPTPPPELAPDFLLIVYFGYLVPNWLLNWPRLSSINVHPSDLPAWRGASPGQFVILAGLTQSAVSIMIPNSKMDQGDLLKKLPFNVDPSWTKDQYYDFAFDLTATHLPQTLLDFAEHQLTPQPQPLLSPTPTARQLKKNDGFIPWEYLLSALSGQPAPLNNPQLNLKKSPQNNSNPNSPQPPFLLDLLPQLSQLNPNLSLAPATVIARAWRALTPWPGIWTLQPQSDAPPKRLKILQLHLENPNSPSPTLILDQVLLEGKSQPTSFQLPPA